MDGKEFKLGTFTHVNECLVEPLGLDNTEINRFKVFLKLTANFDQGGPILEFAFAFDHDETDIGPDEVQLPSAQLEKTVTLNGNEYALHIFGFYRNGKLVSQLVTDEGRSKSADLTAKLVPAPAKQSAPSLSAPEVAPSSPPSDPQSPVPEPAQAPLSTEPRSTLPEAVPLAASPEPPLPEPASGPLSAELRTTLPEATPVAASPEPLFPEPAPALQPPQLQPGLPNPVLIRRSPWSQPPAPEPVPQSRPPYLPDGGGGAEDPCPVKTAADTASLFALALERLNRRSVVSLLEHLIAAVNAQCAKLADRPTGDVSPADVDKLRSELLIAIDELRQSANACASEARSIKQQIGKLVASLPQKIEQTIQNIDSAQVTHQIQALNTRLVIIQEAAQELDDGELKQVQGLLVKLLLNIDFGSVVRNISIEFGGRRVVLWRLLEVLATADRVANIQIRYGDPDPWEIAGAYFVLTDSTPVSFRARVLPDPSGLRIVYLFETDDWKGLPARFSFAYLVRKSSYAICGNRFNLDTFDGVEQTKVIFDLC